DSRRNHMTEPRLSILFLCTGNPARSQMAEAILRHLSHGAIDVASAGTVPQAHIHLMAERAVARLLNLDTTGQSPISVDTLVKRHCDYVITVCDHAADTCPVFPGDTERIHWGYEDPEAVTGSEEQKQRAFDDVARQLLARMRVWLSLPALRDRIEAHRVEKS